MRWLNSLLSCSMALVAHCFPQGRMQADEVEQSLTVFRKAVGNGAPFESPFHRKAVRRSCTCGPSRGMEDHVPIGSAFNPSWSRLGA